MDFSKFYFIAIVFILPSCSSGMIVKKNTNKVETVSSRDVNIIENKKIHEPSVIVDSVNRAIVKSPTSNHSVTCGGAIIDYSFCVENLNDYYSNPVDWINWEKVNSSHSCSRINFKFYKSFTRNKEVVDFCVKNVYNYFLDPKLWLEWEEKNYINSCSRFNPNFTRNTLICATS